MTQQAVSDRPPCGSATASTLIAGRHITVGATEISNDETHLQVALTTTGGWVLTELHLWAGTDLDDVPKNKKGKPVPGRFPYHAGPFAETGYSFSIPMTWNAGDVVHVLAHAVVARFNEQGNEIQEETAWSGCQKWPEGRSWAYYCSHPIQACCKTIAIPRDPVTACHQFPGPESYWGITLGGVPEGYAVLDDVPYLGWCVQQSQFLAAACHSVQLWASNAPDLPLSLQDPDWDLVNYIINHKDRCPNATIFDIQAAIWFFTDNIPPSDPDAQCLVEDASANGDGYCPAAGEMLAVIVEHLPLVDGHTPNAQRTFIEVDP